MKPLVLYHGPGCADGFCAAWAARLAMPDAECVPANYGQEPPDVTGRDLYIVDFSYKRPIMERLIHDAAEIVVLDHHRTAQAEFAGLDKFAMTCGTPHCFLFNMDKSGGRLAWEHFFPGRDLPWLVRYTEDRDLWLWRLPYSREISAVIASHPFDFAIWDAWYDEGREPGRKYWESLIDEGRAILRYQAQQVESACANAFEMDLAGHKILAVNTTTLTSEIAGKLAEGRPFGAAFFIGPDGKKRWSLRSREGGIDVSEIAKAKGGGGHRQAAGFEGEP